MVTTPFAEHEDWDDERVAQAQQDKHNTMADLARQVCPVVGPCASVRLRGIIFVLR